MPGSAGLLTPIGGGVVWNTECSPERSVVVGWLAPAECMCWDCAGASLETGSFEGQALSSGPGARTGWTYAAEKLIARCVFWQSCVRLVIVCRGSVWRDSAECCATVCEWCVQWRRRQVCLCATGKTVLGVQRQDVNGEWGTVLRDVGRFYISGGSGGQMDADLAQRGNRIGGGPAHFWSQQEQPQLRMQAQRHPQPWLPDMVSVGDRCDVRDAAGSGRWGQCLSGYTNGEERSAVRGGYPDPQTRSEYVSSEESDSHSRQSRKSHHRHASSRRTLRTRRSSSRWRKPSPSSSSSRSPSAGSSARRRHRSPPLPKPQVFAGKKGEWNGFIFQFRKTARYFGWSQQEKAYGARPSTSSCQNQGRSRITTRHWRMRWRCGSARWSTRHQRDGSLAIWDRKRERP